MEKKDTILEEAQKAVYGDRQADYGSVSDNFKAIADLWSVVLKVPVTAEQVGLCMIQVKVAREMFKAKRDNIVDICGYAACIEKMKDERLSAKSEQDVFINPLRNCKVEVAMNNEEIYAKGADWIPISTLPPINDYYYYVKYIGDATGCAYYHRNGIWYNDRDRKKASLSSITHYQI